MQSLSQLETQMGMKLRCEQDGNLDVSLLKQELHFSHQDLYEPDEVWNVNDILTELSMLKQKTKKSPICTTKDFPGSQKLIAVGE